MGNMTKTLLNSASLTVWINMVCADHNVNAVNYDLPTTRTHRNT